MSVVKKDPICCEVFKSGCGSDTAIACEVVETRRVGGDE
jgi:hypothetical protein